MEYSIFILLELIYFCSSYYVTPIFDYDIKHINFTSIKNYSIFHYNYIKVRKYGKPSFVLKIPANYKFYYYIYKSLNQIQTNEKGFFINYLHYGKFKYQGIYNGSNFIKNDTEEYYIIIQQEKKMNLSTTFTIYPYVVKFDIYTAIGAFIIGIVLSLPNIIFQIVRKCKNKMTSSEFTFLMNIICHIIYGSFILELKFTGYGSFIMTFFLGIIYIFFCFFFLYESFRGDPKSIFYVVCNLCKKLKDSKTLQDVVSYNRKVPPKLYINATASHEESREVWEEYGECEKPIYRNMNTRSGSSIKYVDHYEKEERQITTHYSRWGRVDKGGGKFNGIPGGGGSRYIKKTEYKTIIKWTKKIEYKYNSWQDETKSLSDINYYPIITVTFDSEFILDTDSLDAIKKIKDDLYREGRKYDTDVKTKEDFSSPDMINQHKCSLNEKEYQRIKKSFGNCCGFFWWFILFILGYSSMFEAFASYEVGHEQITIKKYISFGNNCRASYMMKDECPPSITFNFIYTKMQQSSIEKKIKKGILDEKALETPLIVIN